MSLSECSHQTSLEMTVPWLLVPVKQLRFPEIAEHPTEFTKIKIQWAAVIVIETSCWSEKNSQTGWSWQVLQCLRYQLFTAVVSRAASQNEQPVSLWGGWSTTAEIAHQDPLLSAKNGNLRLQWTKLGFDGWMSRTWLKSKREKNKMPFPLKLNILIFVMLHKWLFLL